MDNNNNNFNFDFQQAQTNEELREMRRAYCLANGIEFEEEQSNDSSLGLLNGIFIGIPIGLLIGLIMYFYFLVA